MARIGPRPYAFTKSTFCLATSIKCLVSGLLPAWIFESSQIYIY